jgi:hypothetical protein
MANKDYAVKGLEIGEFTRLPYDNDTTYLDKQFISVGTGNYRLSEDNMYNEKACLSTLGPRYSRMGPCNATIEKLQGKAYAQELVDLESIFTNRNVLTSKARTAHLNPINPTLETAKYQTPECGKFLIPEYSRLQDPPCNYRDTGINRFYNPIRDLQKNIFWNFAVDTRLEVKDNVKLERRVPWKDIAQPPVPYGKEPV